VTTKNNPANPMNLWNLQTGNGTPLHIAMLEDFRVDKTLPCSEHHLNQCLHYIDKQLQILSNETGSFLDKYGLPQPTTIFHDEQTHDADFMINTDEEQKHWKQAFELFNQDQKEVFEKIDSALQRKAPELFFVDAVGGTGKTFVFGALLSKWHSEKKMCLLWLQQALLLYL
jgi:PIF1-like helicase